MNDYIEAQIRFFLTQKLEAEVKAEIDGRFEEMSRWILPIVPIEKVLDVQALMNELKALTILSAVARRTRDALDKLVEHMMTEISQ